MKLRLLAKTALAVALSAAALPAGATKLIGLKVVDKNYLMVHFRDGEVRYRDDGTGPSAYLGHTFVEGDDTLKVFGQRLDASVAAQAQGWKITSSDDKAFGSLTAAAAWRKSKPMNTDNTLTSELDHWIFLQLPKSMKQGCTYTVTIPADVNVAFNATETAFGTIEVTASQIHPNKCIKVELTSDGKLENSIDATKVIPYAIKDSEGAAFTSATYLTEGDKTELSIHITANDWNAAYAGEYSDTVTFTVSYEDK